MMTNNKLSNASGKCYLYQTAEPGSNTLESSVYTLTDQPLAAFSFRGKTSVKVAFQSIFPSHLLNHLIQALISAD